MKSKKVLAFFILLAIPAYPSQAYWVWSPESGKFVNPEEGNQDIAHEKYEYAMQLYREKDLDKASDELKELLKTYRTSKIAPEAQYRLGIIHEEKSDYLKAFEAYKAIIETYPQSERIDEVLEREFRIGNLFLSGRKGKLMGLEILPSLPRAAEVFEHIVKQAPFSEFGDEAQFRLGLTYKKMGRFDEASNAFQAVLDNYPQSDLVAEARFQVAENAFQKSNVEKRDQRALEKASEAVDHFLMRYPDAETSEKASKLRSEIDEKNAEKNYRIGSYYEKSNYLSSAIIYYKDVAKRYPETKWGVKAKAKLESLEQPVAYLGNQEEKIQSEIELTRAKLETTDKKKDELGHDALERALERLKQRQKSLDKDKEESLNAREDDLKRRQGELKEKGKKLDKKKELLKTNQSEDFKKAIEKWQASLDQEKDELQRERQQLRDWKEQLGMDNDSMLSILPFVGEAPSALEEVRRIEAKKLYKVSDEKKDVLEEKELLYKQYQEVSESLSRFEYDRTGITKEQEDFSGVLAQGQAGFEVQEETMEQTAAEIKALQDDYERKNKEYKDKFGESLWDSFFIGVPKDVVAKSAGAVNKSIGFLNPFSADESTMDAKSIQELAELQMHQKEKIAAQQELVDTLTLAFDEELAMQEQRRLMESLDSAEDTDVKLLRKDIKQVEKEIRSAYEDINDRHDRITASSKELESVLERREGEKGIVSQAGNVVTAPARLIANASRDFFLGRRTKESKLSNEAGSIPADGELANKAKDLKEQIELDGLMIESRSREIYNLTKELDLLKTKASLSGGYKFRSSIVTVPYAFMEDALDSARSLVPSKDRKDMLINRLNEETKHLEEYRRQLSEVQNRMKSAEPARAEEKVEALAGVASTDQLSPDLQVEEELLRGEITTLREKMNKAKSVRAHQKRLLDTEKAAVEREVENKKDDKNWDHKVENLSDKEETLSKELKDLGEELRDLIKKEGDLETKEAEIIEKRINKIDQLVKSTGSKASAQDLLTEKGRLEDRLSQLELRKDFLTKEIERF